MLKDLGIFELMVEKIAKVKRRNYIGKCGSFVTLSNYFPVPKGENDIRMVYDLTASGLNAALWAPRFWMPTMTNVVDCAVHTSWFGDVDAGEMFLNLPLDLRMRKYCGVDISWMKKDGTQLWECWHRMAMGMKPSPWVTIRLLSWMVEIVIGDVKEISNPFRWDSVRMNLPGAEDYNPALPRVVKWNERENATACDCNFFATILELLVLLENSQKRLPITLKPPCPIWAFSMRHKHLENGQGPLPSLSRTWVFS